MKKTEKIIYLLWSQPKQSEEERKHVSNYFLFYGANGIFSARYKYVSNSQGSEVIFADT